MQGYKEIEENILSTAMQRGIEKSTCPSEIARKLYPENWPDHMKDIVAVAIDLHHQGKVVITQKGEAIDVSQIKGPIRIKIR